MKCFTANKQRMDIHRPRQGRTVLEDNFLLRLELSSIDIHVRRRAGVHSNYPQSLIEENRMCVVRRRMLMKAKKLWRERREKSLSTRRKMSSTSQTTAWEKRTIVDFIARAARRTHIQIDNNNIPTLYIFVVVIIEALDRQAKIIDRPCSPRFGDEVVRVQHMHMFASACVCVEAERENYARKKMSAEFRVASFVVCYRSSDVRWPSLTY